MCDWSGARKRERQTGGGNIKERKRETTRENRSERGERETKQTTQIQREKCREWSGFERRRGWKKERKKD